MRTLAAAVALLAAASFCRAGAEVLLYEDFEQMPKSVAWMQEGGWFDFNIGPGKGMELTTEVECPKGKQCIKYNLKQGKLGSGGMFHKIRPVETIYYRYYRMFEKSWEWPKGYGPHDGMIFGGKWQAPTNTDLSLYLDFWMSGETVVRVASAMQKLGYGGWGAYMKDKYGPSPNGAQAFPYNKSKPDLIVPGKWHCVEMMAKLSTPGKDDGEVRLWVNGKLVSEYTDVPLRDENHPDLRLDMVFIAPYFHPGSPKDQVHYLDELAVSTEYIGPVDYKKPEAKPAEPQASAPAVAVSPEESKARADDAKAAELYRAARDAERQGMKDLAKSLYERLLKEHPGSAVAAEAKKRLEQ